VRVDPTTSGKHSTKELRQGDTVSVMESIIISEVSLSSVSLSSEDTGPNPILDLNLNLAECSDRRAGPPPFALRLSYLVLQPGNTLHVLFVHDISHLSAYSDVSVLRASPGLSGRVLTLKVHRASSGSASSGPVNFFPLTSRNGGHGRTLTPLPKRRSWYRPSHACRGVDHICFCFTHCTTEKLSNTV
jgi:hypothetical protein